MRKYNSKIGRCLKFFALQKIGMTPTLLSYSGLSRVSRVFKWILGTSPRMTKERVCAKFLTCIGMTILFCLLPSTAYAECTPAPDCASIGYTETSCETTSLKCPFDTTKLYCLPCDSSFKYNCNASNQIGVGNACNGKYASCECVSGATFNNGSCVCDTSCTVGAIYYSDKTCSACVVSGKTAIGVIVKDNELITALTVPDMTWGKYGTDLSDLTNYTSSANAQTDYNGKSNTAIIVAAHTSESTSTSAAKYCNSYSTAGTSVGDWYLPSAGAVYDYIYRKYSTVKAGWDKVKTTISDSWFWSSSEYNNYNSWIVSSLHGGVASRPKDNSVSVSCFLVIK